MAAGEIDDAEAAHAEPKPRRGVDPFVVRAPVPEDIAHAVDERELRARRCRAGLCHPRIRESRNPAHCGTSLPR